MTNFETRPAPAVLDEAAYAQLVNMYSWQDRYNTDLSFTAPHDGAVRNHRLNFLGHKEEYPTFQLKFETDDGVSKFMFCAYTGDTTGIAPVAKPDGTIEPLAQDEIDHALAIIPHAYTELQRQKAERIQRKGYLSRAIAYLLRG